MDIMFWMFSKEKNLQKVTANVIELGAAENDFCGWSLIKGWGNYRVAGDMWERMFTGNIKALNNERMVRKCNYSF